MRAIVIDDEKPSREVLCNFLTEYCDGIKVVASASSVKSGFRNIIRHKPDLVFLDIELGDGKGFDLLSRFESIDFRIIFVTAYSEHAIRAFRVNAIDYLLKPVKIEELKSAVEKARLLNTVIDNTAKIAGLLKGLGESAGMLQPTIIIPHLKGFDVLKINEIIMLKADGYCTEFYLTGKRKILSSKNLKNYEDILKHNGPSFIRVHNSYIVNLNYVSSFTNQGEIHLEEDNNAFLGDFYKTSFNNLIHKK